MVLHKGAMAGDAYKDWQFLEVQGVSFGYWQSPTLGLYISENPVKTSENAKEKFLVNWSLLTIFNIVDTPATPCNAREWPEMIDKKH